MGFPPKPSLAFGDDPVTAALKHCEDDGRSIHSQLSRLQAAMETFFFEMEKRSNQFLAQF